MPTTATGTAYTVYSANLGVHGVCYWAVADAVEASADIPTILYAHGAGGASNQFATLSAWSGLRDWLIDNGWAWVEGSGGDGTGTQNWGNPGARAAYPAYLAHVQGILDIGDVVLLGRSMGGLVTSWLYANDTTGQYAGWINNSAVSTLFVGDTSGGGSSIDRSTGRYFTTAQYNAWGESDYAGWEAAVLAADAAPEGWDPAVWAGKNILSLYGTADTVVPWYPRGASTLRNLWAGLPAIDIEYARPDGDHGTLNGSYLDVAPMVEFLILVGGGAPIPPPPTDIFRVTGSWLYMEDGRHVMEPKHRRVFTA